jgi:hypothetical protein
MTLIYTLNIYDTETHEEFTAASENIAKLYRWEGNLRWRRAEEERAERAASMARHPSSTGTIVTVGSLWGKGQSS